MNLKQLLRNNLVFFMVSVLGVLSACTHLHEQPYQRPEIPQKAQWTETEATLGVGHANMTIEKDWWRTFGDAYLNDLIHQALTENFDLKILAGRVELAGLGLMGQKSGLLPKVSASTGVSLQKQNNAAVTENYSVQGSLSWEIDIWGRIRKGIRSQTASYQASEADWRAGHLTLVADVATRYFQIRLMDEQIDSQRNSFNKNQLILNNYQAQFKEGLLSSTQLLSQKAELNSLRQQLIELTRQRKIAENSLATLLGKPAGSLVVPTARLSDSVALPEVPAGLPADLLSRRPDIIAAEYRVLQAHALVGQAKVAKLPSISLTSNGGLASGVLSQILKTWSFGLAPSINIPIFDPSLDVQVKSNEIQARIAEQTYRKTVMTAFEEVENALINLDFRKQQKSEIDKQLQHLRVVSGHIQARLQEGMVSN